MTRELFDTAIVGGGAAGLSAALVLARSRRSVVLLDAGAPRNAPAAHMHGFLSRDGFPPSRLLEIGREEIASYGARLVPHSVTSVTGDAGDGFVLTTDEGVEIAARRIILATGVEDVLPDIPGAREAWGRFLLHCPYCHGYEVGDGSLAVFGGVPGAVRHALLLRQWSSDLTYFANGSAIAEEDARLLGARGIRVNDGRIAELLLDGESFRGVRLESGDVVPVDAVFLRPESRPRTELVAALGGVVDGAGFAHLDASGRTSVPGVWVTGNLVDPRGQVITAAGHANAVAMDVNADLVDDDVRVELLETR
ncbi:NAD(P)/FAD-dependent oxidoreductase [Microbacterium azadirachtae]|uniref:Thioredoxin reductase n=1 Tax=Microbacterium azadirachtae TaxID=582680 RepID=A0A0F0LV19_9MICO|nr:NAD(P)/FAD-dependent oxidoreductase [Microbacterium azadirachtae]KJL37157.1 Thioredoxin reductase [Microbacterium azadirachtae]